MNVEEVPLESLTLDPKNARAHPERNMAAIKASLTQFQQVEPLVVQRSTGRVIGGNGRLEAMKALGWKTAKIVRVDIDDRGAEALGIALNRTAELATWDFTNLADILQEIDTGDFPMEAVGYLPGELEQIANYTHSEELKYDECPTCGRKLKRKKAECAS